MLTRSAKDASYLRFRYSVTIWMLCCDSKAHHLAVLRPLLPILADVLSQEQYLDTTSAACNSVKYLEVMRWKCCWRMAWSLRCCASWRIHAGIA